MSLKLVKPTLAHQQQLEQFIQQMLDSQDNFDGTANLNTFHSVTDWIEWVNTQTDKQNCKEGWVPFSQFLSINEHNKLVGLINIRHQLNPYLAQFGGHIGYVIAPKYRNKGYAKQQLRLALAKAQELGLSNLLLTCDATNFASRKVIESCGGVYQDSLTNGENQIKRRYWIELSSVFPKTGG